MIDNHKNDTNQIQESDSNEHINMITRQTDLTYEEAKNQLEINNGDYMKVLESYFGIKKTTTKKQLTINQQIYSEIRHIMDDAAQRFYSKRDKETSN